MNRLEENTKHQFQKLLIVTLTEQEESTRIMETILKCTNEVAGRRRTNQHQDKNNFERKEFTELCKTIRQKNIEGFKHYNERVNETKN